MISRVYAIVVIVILCAMIVTIFSGCAKPDDKLFGDVSAYMLCKNEGRC